MSREGRNPDQSAQVRGEHYRASDISATSAPWLRCNSATSMWPGLVVIGILQKKLLGKESDFSSIPGDADSTPIDVCKGVIKESVLDISYSPRSFLRRDKRGFR